MNEDCLKLTTYFGERDRTNGRFLADALLDVYERHALQVSALFRGSAGFGLKHRLHTDRLLTLSEDLPIVSVAVAKSTAATFSFSALTTLFIVSCTSCGGSISFSSARTISRPQ